MRGEAVKRVNHLHLLGMAFLGDPASPRGGGGGPSSRAFRLNRTHWCRPQLRAAERWLHVSQVQGTRDRAALQLPRVRPDARVIGAPGALVPPPVPGGSLRGGRA
jgi:hypothetical protein